MATSVNRKSRGKKFFLFFELPLELRLRIYEYALTAPNVIDLDVMNSKHVMPLLRLLQVSKAFYEEAYPVFYKENIFRLFPLQSHYYKTKRPLIARLPAKHRKYMTQCELRLGPGWNNPPRAWAFPARGARVSRLWTNDLTSVKILHIFVECDPGHEIFNGFRVDEHFYTKFSGALVKDTFERCPSINVVRFDAWPSVVQDCALVQELVRQVEIAGLRIVWGNIQSREDKELANAVPNKLTTIALPPLIEVN